MALVRYPFIAAISFGIAYAGLSAGFPADQKSAAFHITTVVVDWKLGSQSDVQVGKFDF